MSEFSYDLSGGARSLADEYREEAEMWKARAKKFEGLLKEAVKLLYRSKCQQELLYSSKWEDDFEAFLEKAKK